MDVFINHNGIVTNANTKLIEGSNRSFRYGDGCFETMKLVNGKIQLSDYHFERLFASLKVLQMDVSANFTADSFYRQILELAAQNDHYDAGRIRLMVYRNNIDATQPNVPGYVIETLPLPNHAFAYNPEGLRLGIYDHAQKSCDSFSNLKSNNYLTYVMAGLWATQRQLNDAIVCNAYGRVADSSIANIFLVEDGVVKTPPLSEGCVAGTMRRYLIECLRKENIPFFEEAIYPLQLTSATEVFLTNAIKGIAWAGQMDNTVYTNQMSQFLYEHFVATLF